MRSTRPETHARLGSLPLTGLLLATASIVGCATSPTITPPTVPEALRPPAGEVAFLATPASGFQIYECTRRPDQAYAWDFRGPEAVLYDGRGETVGKHYAGPTWESVDQSQVVGVVKAHAPSPVEGSIPWLLLSAKTTSGPGTFAETKSIQRVQTSGGLAPLSPCSPDAAGQTVKVPYQATYFFYR